MQTVKKDSSNEVEKIICEEKDDRQVGQAAVENNVSLTSLTELHLLSDLQVLLHIEEKLFAYLHQAVFREDNGKAVRTRASSPVQVT